MKMFIARNFIIKIISFFIGAVICINVFLILYDWLSLLFPSEETSDTSKIEMVRGWLDRWNILYANKGLMIKVILILVVLFFIESGRNLIFFLLKRFFKFFALLPGKQTLAFLSRYLSIGRFAFYKNQRDIFEKLKGQYPKGSRFVVLPMDMEYMKAGKTNESYKMQMHELVSIKAKHPSIFYPFVFIDPRRIKEQTDFFQYRLGANQEVILEDCEVKKYIEDNKFSGFKIYPALGYYPFEEELLPVWKYAVQHKLPILTHCIRGTIFYRGTKKAEWDTHRFFLENDSSPDPLLLPETKNQDFQINFTHPLNYLVLLKEYFLTKAVARSTDPRIKLMFGFKDENTELQSNLHDLKLCFGHFGGDDEWQNYFEADRDQYSPAILHKPFGIDFLKNAQGNFSNSKLAQLWKSTDWYSIICSLMLQHPNVYSDISYILHNPDIWPLLNDTLDRNSIPEGSRRLADAVLFGTDFYVVRNHKSEKQLFAELKHNLSLEEVDKISRINPSQFV